MLNKENNSPIFVTILLVFATAISFVVLYKYDHKTTAFVVAAIGLACIVMLVNNIRLNRNLTYYLSGTKAGINKIGIYKEILGIGNDLDKSVTNLNEIDKTVPKLNAIHAMIIDFNLVTPNVLNNIKNMVNEGEIVGLTSLDNENNVEVIWKEKNQYYVTNYNKKERKIVTQKKEISSFDELIKTKSLLIAKISNAKSNIPIKEQQQYISKNYTDDDDYQTWVATQPHTYPKEFKTFKTNVKKYGDGRGKKYQQNDNNDNE